MEQINGLTTYQGPDKASSPQFVVALFRGRGGDRLHLLAETHDDGLVCGRHFIEVDVIGF